MKAIQEEFTVILSKFTIRVKVKRHRTIKILYSILVPGKEMREEFLLDAVDRLGGLVVIAPARRAGDPGSNPGPGENFFLLNY